MDINEEEIPISLELKEMGVIDGSKAYKGLLKLMKENADKTKKLNEIIEYAKNRCKDHIDDDSCACEYCEGVFAACRRILIIAGEDIEDYE